MPCQTNVLVATTPKLGINFLVKDVVCGEIALKILAKLPPSCK